MRYHRTSTRMTITTSVDENMEKLESSVYCWWDHKTVWSLRKTIWQFLKMLNTELSNGPAISHLGRSENKCPQRDLYMNVRMFVTALLILA